MEILGPNNHEEDESLDNVESGESKDSKKKKKKTTKAVLPIKKELAKETKEKQSEKPEEEASEAKGILPDLKETPDSEAENSVEISETEHEVLENELEPNAESMAEEDSVFLGELVIDHSDENQSEILPHDEEIVETPELSDVEHTDENQPETPIINPPVENIFTVSEPEQPADIEPEIAQPVRQESLADTLGNYQHQTGPEFTANMFNPNLNQQPISNETEKDNSKEVNRAAYYGEKRGLHKGVVTGLFFGWWLGRRNRSEQRQMKRDIDLNTASIGEVQDDLTAAKTALNKRVGLLERTQNEFQKAVNRTVQETSKISTRIAELSPFTPKISEITNQSKEVSQPTVEVKKDNKNEEPRSIEDYIAEANKRAENNKTRIESSAWHNIEVDEKTGKLVEKPSFEYGEAFKNEQQQEKLARQAANAQAASQVGATLLSQDPILNYDYNTSNQSRVGQKSNTAPVTMTYVTDQIVKNTTNPAIWAVALLLVIFLIATGIL